ncbi:hypothetical protein KLP28_01750 [Nocardioidaceae bacterium]|nr:hypothetical protein KLP28_01750 [Nocardioidaceae bacterium]
MTHLDTRETRGLWTQLEALNLTQHLDATVETYLDRADALKVASQTIDQTFEGARDGIVTKLARGELTEAKAREALVKARNAADHSGLTSRALADASRRAGALAGRTLARERDGLVTRVLAPEGERIIERLREADATLGHIDNGDAAISAGEDTATAWVAVVQCHERWEALLRIVKALRLAEVLDGRAGDDFLYYGAPELRQPTLIQSLRAGAAPRLVTEAQAQEQYREAQEEAARQAEAAQGVRRVGGRHDWGTIDSRRSALDADAAEIMRREAVATDA